MSFHWAATGVLRLALGLLLACTSFAPGGARAGDVLIFAAASLKPALDTILARPDIAAIGNVKVSYAASSQLARQIEAGSRFIAYGIDSVFLWRAAERPN